MVAIDKLAWHMREHHNKDASSNASRPHSAEPSGAAGADDSLKSPKSQPTHADKKIAGDIVIVNIHRLLVSILFDSQSVKLSVISSLSTSTQRICLFQQP